MSSKFVSCAHDSMVSLVASAGGRLRRGVTFGERTWLLIKGHFWETAPLQVRLPEGWPLPLYGLQDPTVQTASWGGQSVSAFVSNTQLPPRVRTSWEKQVHVQPVALGLFHSGKRFLVAPWPLTCSRGSSLFPFSLQISLLPWRR